VQGLDFHVLQGAADLFGELGFAGDRAEDRAVRTADVPRGRAHTAAVGHHGQDLPPFLRIQHAPPVHRRRRVFLLLPTVQRFLLLSFVHGRLVLFLGHGSHFLPSGGKGDSPSSVGRSFTPCFP
jgi:hypothetical protein